MDELKRIVEAKGLGKVYPRCEALANADFHIDKGEIVGLVGRNGAGKTTIIRLLAGLAVPTSGSFSLFGESEESRIAPLRKKMACMVEYPALYNNMTARQNMMEKAIMERVPKAERENFIREQLSFVGLEGAYEDRRPVKNYSMGMRQRLSIAMALVGKPELMVLDEPTNGLDPEGIRQIRDLLFTLNREKGVTMLISSHILGELWKLATRFIFIDRGRILESLTSEELEAKAGKVIYLNTTDDQEALKVLLENGYDASLLAGRIAVNKVAESATVLNLLIGKGLGVTSLKEEENSLEDYFFSLIGEGRR